MSPQPNSSLSVDCVVFGFDGAALKVLLVERDFVNPAGERIHDFKLPGSLIFQDEELRASAARVLDKYMGRRDIYLRQLHVFSQPDRVVGEELRWLNEHYGVHTGRVVTVGYYALVKLNEALIASAAAEHAQWVGVERVTRLAMDHKQIMARALETLGRQLMVEPIAFELLPRKFTLRQLQVLYEAILGIEIDNRNFRKKVLSSGYLRETGLSFYLPERLDYLQWERKGMWSCYPEGAFAGNTGETSLYNPKQVRYGENPAQPWSADTHNYYYWADAGANCDRPLTQMAKGMKENIYRYTLSATGGGAGLTVCSPDASLACRTSKRGDGQLMLYINNRWDYPEIAWGNYCKTLEAVPCYGEMKIRF